MVDTESRCPESPLVKGWFPLLLGALLASPGTTSVTESLRPRHILSTAAHTPQYKNLGQFSPTQDNSDGPFQPLPVEAAKALVSQYHNLTSPSGQRCSLLPSMGSKPYNIAGILNAASGPASWRTPPVMPFIFII